MSVGIIAGDCREELRRLPENHFHCCITSPPYFGQRDYKVANQIGVEPTPKEYVDNLVGVFREVRRTLREDGTFWLNLGDSYSGGGKGGNPGNSPHIKQQTNAGSLTVCGVKRDEGSPKNLLGIPWRVAFALQQDGWILRQWMPWVKRNPMPESVTDRPGSACETIFLLAKSGRYFYDAEAVRMAGRIPAGTLGAKGSAERSSTPGVNSRPPEYKVYSGTRNRRNSDNFWDTWQGMLTDEGGDPLAFVVNTKGFKGAHFATFPEKLVSPMVKCATSEMGCCWECGAPVERVTEKAQLPRDAVYDGSKFVDSEKNFSQKRIQMMITAGRKAGLPHDNPQPETVTVGWQPSCLCDFEDFRQPCRVLDPFGGAGTVGLVCRQLGRSATLIELNPEYAEMSRQRIPA